LALAKWKLAASLFLQLFLKKTAKCEGDHSGGSFQMINTIYFLAGGNNFVMVASVYVGLVVRFSNCLYRKLGRQDQVFITKLLAKITVLFINETLPKYSVSNVAIGLLGKC
jgi:hypothetical protein